MSTGKLREAEVTISKNLVNLREKKPNDFKNAYLMNCEVAP